MRILILLCFLTFLSCEKRNEPQADFYIIGHSFKQDGWAIASEGDTIACCYPYKVEVELKNVFRYRIDYSCDAGQSTIAPTGKDTVWFTQRGAKWIQITAWNNDGEEIKKRKNYFVK